ncbi:MAG: hypothetical protein GF329_03915 [Candidatus Lokiarchaeota archaeon]|nr:hypothetical protein [Candidatus Lokiarchaeota archaeon]
MFSRFSFSKIHLKSLYFILIIYSLFILLMALVPYEILIIYIYPDDSYYFFEIAKNLSRNGILSFDTIHITNGFQPLWLLLLLPIFFFDISNLFALRIIILYQGLITGFTLILVYKTLKKMLDKHAAKLGTLILAFLPISFIVYLDGCEASLNLFLLSLIVYYIVNKDFTQLSYNKVIFLAVLSGLSIFTRLDNVIIISAILSWLGFIGIIKFKKENIKFIILFLCVFPLIPGAYLLWNYITFGHIMPISGILWNSSTEYAIFYVILVIGLCFLVSLLTKFICKQYNKQKWNEISPHFKFIIIIILLPIFHLSYYFIVGGRVVAWYLPVELLSVSIGGAFAFFYFTNTMNPNKKGRLANFSALSSILTFTIIYIFITTSLNIRLYNLSPRYYAATQWVNENTSEDAIIASANAGFLGYFIERPLIETWGLVNSFEFVEKYKGNRTKFIIEGEYDYYIDMRQSIPLSNAEMQAQNLTLEIEFYDVWAPERTLQVWKKNSSV